MIQTSNEGRICLRTIHTFLNPKQSMGCKKGSQSGTENVPTEEVCEQSKVRAWIKTPSMNHS